MQVSTPLQQCCEPNGDRPTIGDLMSLCEENYCALHRLAPNLATLRGPFVSCDEAGADLLLEVREQAPFTTLFRLTHLFAGPQDIGRWRPDPDAILRAYHDAGQVEVLDLRQTALPVFNHYRAPALLANWKASLFLSKWLRYCLAREHRFPPVTNRPLRPSEHELTPIP
ncbi:MAG TPA: DUF1249 domain-containing protein [Chromatiaceae bacterium]|nr:MAG: hypothetical protein N838_21195 [Thiohalocapsa sp. PB-PSB1]QQO56981.1 MAG: DUF1249 domain-containing protein [Thiohalocapsa sp. PB-PSB1]HBG97077.1 DUF1249 domain-containing protein [Chromatiaceae bacterium]HCS89837.1 DUF1249 domain-containing protein [Chromatiaceae bacterium]